MPAVTSYDNTGPVIDNLVALRARDDLLHVVRCWPELQSRLAAGGGNALTGLPSAAGDQLPIDVTVSDLMRQIEERARFYAHVLLDDDPDWAPRTSTMPGLLAEVAGRYGHFTHGEDERMALDFCDDAHEMVRMVDGLLTPREPADYIGPCPITDHDGAGCPGELYLRPDRDRGWCHACGTEYTRASQQQHLISEMADRLMTLSEITSALHVLIGRQVPYRTVQSWARRKRLLERTEGLYLLADALELATGQRVVPGAIQGASVQCA